MCWVAKGLIAACIGYLPSPGSAVTVKRDCIYKHSKIVRGAAAMCAHENNVTYRIEP